MFVNHSELSVNIVIILNLIKHINTKKKEECKILQLMGNKACLMRALFVTLFIHLNPPQKSL